jgi:hypothetical protein
MTEQDVSQASDDRNRRFHYSQDERKSRFTTLRTTEAGVLISLRTKEKGASLSPEQQKQLPPQKIQILSTPS